jgi:hypothetical protein
MRTDLGNVSIAATLARSSGDRSFRTRILRAHAYATLTNAATRGRGDFVCGNTAPTPVTPHVPFTRVPTDPDHWRRD